MNQKNWPLKKKKNISELLENCTTSDAEIGNAHFSLLFERRKKSETPYYTCHMSVSCITCLVSHRMCLMGHVTCDMVFETCHMSLVPCHMSLVPCHLILAVLSGSRSLISGPSVCWYASVRWYLSP